MLVLLLCGFLVVEVVVGASAAQLILNFVVFAGFSIWVCFSRLEK